MTHRKATRPFVRAASILLIFLVDGGAAVWAAAPESTAAEEAHGEAIRAARERSNAAIRQHDLDRILAVLDDDAGLRASSGRLFVGHEAQHRAYAGQFARFPDLVYIRTPDTVTVGESGVEASERGSWIGRWTDDGDAVEVRGEYMAMWRLRDEGWRLHAELFVRLGCDGCAQ